MLRIIGEKMENILAPRFSWKLEGDEGQAAYELTVTDRSGSAVWESGCVESARRHNIPCGAKLLPGERYGWQVSVYGAAGSSDQKRGQSFYTGASDWQAAWVEPDRVRKPLRDDVTPIEAKGVEKELRDARNELDPAVYMRKTVELSQLPELALIHITAHGVYRLWVNGTEVSDLFAPGFTSYASRLEYQTYDVTSLLSEGKNALCAILADGWYTGKLGAMGVGQQFGIESALLFQLECTYPDGGKTVIPSGADMRWSTGAISYSDLYIGEFFEEEKQQSGWLSADFDDTSWAAVTVRDYGYDNLASAAIPGICETRTIQPKVYRAPNGELILDAGETIVGYVSFRLDLPRGALVSMEHSETLTKEGNFLQNIIGRNKEQTDFYLADRDGIHSWAPGFTFHGFRYVRIRGTEDTDPAHYQVHVIGTPLRQTGRFTCSDARLNTLQENILRSQQGNMIGIPTDCPQRERTGWTGDAQIFAPTGCLEMDIEQFMRHWLADMRAEQLPDGQVPHIIPYFPSHDIMKPPGIEGVSAAGWSDAAVIIPWRLYEAYGDPEILAENFEMMKRYMDSVEQLAAEHPQGWDDMPPRQQSRQKYLWNTGFQYGDWLMPSIQMSGRPIFEVVQKTGYAVATLMFAMTTDMMERICLVLGKDELTAHYRELNQNIRLAFADEYILPDGTMKADFQGVCVLALQTGAVPEHLRANALDQLTELIHQNNDLLDTGFLSVPYLLPVLHQNGREALANRLLFRDECPSWLYEVKMGATTMWEYWNGYAPDGTPADCSMNHFAFGCVGEYLFHTILGIQPEEPGFRRVSISPDISCGLKHAEGSYDSIWGTLSVSWKLNGDRVSLDVTVPPDMEAEIRIGAQRVPCRFGANHAELYI